ncbi:hypothetical protein G7K_2018-t1 [Saitoella complicata NRRL Y-17804]|uniref:Protein HRI1 n=1 Tax=Saitoella complicata (strain BCRC 22490 / CBS 7301 / JCM 7358 / NBRC 10748 / NRRL Y-17804) TaxID=698492 RepID=A0A0E9NEI2_SAICN|nr:hypothetical protein G7K_2018-t1 [Saitoella complicata NRRL Y-17804]
MSQHPPLVSRRISIRLLPAPPSEPTDTLVLNGGGTSRFFTDFRPLLQDPGDCEWVFAGCKEKLANGKNEWVHLIDNRGPSESPDVGTSETLLNGDELERGEMNNPETRELCAYEEVWRDEDVPPGSKVVVAQLRRGDGIHGICVQVGTDYQGVVQDTTGHVTAQRSRYENGEWGVTEKYGEGVDLLPLAFDDLGQPIKGVTDKDEEWEIVENYTYTG